MNYEAFTTTANSLIKKSYLDVVLSQYRNQISDWDSIIERLSDDYDQSPEAIEYAFASWLLELMEKIKDEPNWFVQNIESKEFDETLAEFDDEMDDEMDEPPDWYGN